MFPNQPQQPSGPSSTDYLNQIAPKAAPKITLKGPKLFLLIGAALVVVVTIISLIAVSAAGGQKRPLEQLGARLTTTETIVTDAQKNLKSSQLRSLNSNLKIYLTNTNRDISAPLLSAGVNSAKISATVTKQESGEAITARLEDARLNGVYDRVYAIEMTTQLERTINLMKQIYSSTNSKSLKEFLKTSYASLEPTQKAFAEFNAANS